MSSFTLVDARGGSSMTAPFNDAVDRTIEVMRRLNTQANAQRRLTSQQRTRHVPATARILRRPLVAQA